MGDKTLTAGTDYTYEKQTGAFALLKGIDATPTISTPKGVKKQYTVKVTATSLTPMDVPENVAHGDPLSFNLVPDEGYDLPENVPVFLFVGRMMWYKGIRIILEGLAKLRESGQDFRMVFVGGGNDKDEIVALTEKLGLSDRVFFSPPIHDRNLIRAWYCRADMFLFPSTFDTNGLVVREAAACALGSVLVEGSCAAEDVTDNVSGVLIEENADSMAAKLEELCREPEAMKRIGEAAQRDIYISWEDAIGHAWERYAVVIDNYRAGKYPEHEGMSDEFFHNIAKTMDAYNRSREKQQARVNELRRGYAEIRDELTGEQEKLKENLLAGQAKIKDELSQFMERFM